MINEIISPKWLMVWISVGCNIYSMTRIYIADALLKERSALRLVFLDLKMEITGQAADWLTTVSQVPFSYTDILLIDWELLPSSPTQAIEELRKLCSVTLVIVLISYLSVRQQVALSVGADFFISKGEMPQQIIEHLETIVASINMKI